MNNIMSWWKVAIPRAVEALITAMFYRKQRIALVEEEQFRALLEEAEQASSTCGAINRCSSCGRSLIEADISGFVISGNQIRLLCRHCAGDDANDGH